MNRYFVAATTQSNENANAIIDALDEGSARELYFDWCEAVMSERPHSFTIWKLPPESSTPRALNWISDIQEVSPSH